MNGVMNGLTKIDRSAVVCAESAFLHRRETSASEAAKVIKYYGWRFVGNFDLFEIHVIKSAIDEYHRRGGKSDFLLSDFAPDRWLDHCPDKFGLWTYCFFGSKEISDFWKILREKKHGEFWPIYEARNNYSDVLEHKDYLANNAD